MVCGMERGYVPNSSNGSGSSMGAEGANHANPVRAMDSPHETPPIPHRLERRVTFYTHQLFSFGKYFNTTNEIRSIIARIFPAKREEVQRPPRPFWVKDPTPKVPRIRRGIFQSQRQGLCPASPELRLPTPKGLPLPRIWVRIVLSLRPPLPRILGFGPPRGGVSVPSSYPKLG